MSEHTGIATMHVLGEKAHVICASCAAHCRIRPTRATQQVLLFSVMFGFALHRFGGRGTLVFDVIEKTSHVLFSIVGIIMKAAPIGAFGAMAFTIGKYDLGTLLSLGKLMGTFYLTCLVFVFAVLGLISLVHGFSIWKFIKYIKEELFIVLGTSSSESVLPRMMAKLENLGVKKSVVGKWIRDLDVEKMHRHLNNETVEEAENPEEALDKVELHMAAPGKAT